MSSNLSVVEQADKLLPSVQVLESLKVQAQALVDAGMLPPGYKTGAEALVIALRSREMGVLTMRGWQGMFPVTRDGHSRIGYMGNFLLGLIYERLPEAEIITEVNTPLLCKIKARRNKTADYQYFEVTMAEAKASKWDVYYDKDGKCFKPKPTWSDPANMLYWRCTTRTVNRLFGDITGGAAYTKDEIEDIPEKDEYIPPEVKAAEAAPYVTKLPGDPEVSFVTPEAHSNTHSNTIPVEAEVVPNENDKILADLKDAFDACNTKAEVDALWNTVKAKHVKNGVLLNEGLKLKNSRKAVVS